MFSLRYGLNEILNSIQTNFDFKGLKHINLYQKSIQIISNVTLHISEKP
jgi:hypothetical protein